MTLGRLDREDVESIVTQVTGGRVLPVEVMKQIVAKTDGNPLFIEELTKTVLETGILVEDAEGYRLGGPLPPLAIPETLRDSLMARLDRLAPVREIAQVGAAIGREFSFPLMRALVGGDESTLRRALAQLEQAARLVDDLYPAYRWFLFDNRERFSVPYTVFGPLRAALYVGDMYFVFTSTEHIRELSRHFDNNLIRNARIQPNEAAMNAFRAFSSASRHQPNKDVSGLGIGDWGLGAEATEDAEARCTTGLMTLQSLSL